MPDRKALVVFPRPVGLFSLVLQVIGQVFLCRKAGVVPLVYFNSRCLYWSDRGHDGARNVWEYYFDPVSECAITDVVDAGQAELERAEIWEFSRRRVEIGTPRTVDEARVGRIPVREGALVSNVFPVGVVDFLWEMSARRRQALHRIVQEHVRVRPSVADKVARFRAERLGGRVLGVHIRGRERARERLLFAPDGLVPLECYVREIDGYLASHPSSDVFCATDSQYALDALEERYGSRLVYYPATRLSPADEHLGLHHTDPGRHDRAGIGEEVVIECLLLSGCDYLLHGSSNVSLTARLMKPTLDHLDLYRKYGYAWPKLRPPYVRYLAGRLFERMDRVLGPRWRAPLRSVKRKLLRM
jgi:hypothetical protein